MSQIRKVVVWALNLSERTVVAMGAGAGARANGRRRNGQLLGPGTRAELQCASPGATPGWTAVFLSYTTHL